ncbi:PhnA domain-containing protein [Pseudovibrio exalbescens]|uniref:PhnA domain-containing protein n=1 Tax=Pseudovibrio exalbescens TaxID=197461 RepID=UPI0023659B67|nr:alkylphosphonate utilization protein [Pseudovibrio exalbescens]MDD7910021.1 PhnA domain-containing protein [Pseudovibrio exalbescens]
MSLETDLRARAGDKCELCGASENLSVFPVGPDADDTADRALLACQTCSDQMTGAAELDGTHWRCLNESAWSTEAPVQVTAWRMLKKLSAETWAQDLLEMIYLDEETQSWAEAGLEPAGDDEDAIVHKDTHGAVLSAGDTVTLIKDLKVKGAGFTAKRGTAVRNIALVPDNASHIEGRVNDQRIVILTEFVKKN